MFPAFAHFRRTATRDTELLGQEIKEGEKVVMWYVSSNRDETRYEDPDRFDVRRNPEHQAFGAGGRHFCLGAALARLELKVLIEETLARYPEMEIDGDPRTGRFRLRQPAAHPPCAAQVLSGAPLLKWSGPVHMVPAALTRGCSSGAAVAGQRHRGGSASGPHSTFHVATDPLVGSADIEGRLVGAV